MLKLYSSSFNDLDRPSIIFSFFLCNLSEAFLESSFLGVGGQKSSVEKGMETKLNQNEDVIKV